MDKSNRRRANRVARLLVENMACGVIGKYQPGGRDYPLEVAAVEGLDHLCAVHWLVHRDPDIYSTSGNPP